MEFQKIMHRWEKKGYLKEIMVENFPELMKSINPQIQETLCLPNWINKTTHRQIIVKI